MPYRILAIAFVLAALSLSLFHDEPVGGEDIIESQPAISLKDQLIGKNATERANLKGDALSKVGAIAKERVIFANADYEIEVMGVEKIEGGISVLAKAWKNGQPVGFGADGTVEIERFRIFNPPVLVEDPEGDIVSSWTDRFGTVHSRTLKLDPKRAIQEVIADNIRIVGKDGSKIVPGRVGNTTSTFYPDANPETTSVDGRVKQGGAWIDTWANTRNSVTAASANDTDSSGELAATFAFTSSGNWNELVRTHYLFDTSALPDTDTVSSATFSLYVTSKADPHNEISFSLSTSSPASNTALTTSDFQIGVRFGTIPLAPDRTYANITTSAYNDWALTATATASHISKTSISKFGLMLQQDRTNVTPTWAASTYKHITGNYADNTGTTNDPKLVIEHAAAGGTPVDTTAPHTIIGKDAFIGNNAYIGL